jgi:simple sugar transport system substrate-binding protein
VPSHQEAFRAAITAGADGIVSSTPDPGTLNEVVAEATAAGIPVIIINTEDAQSGRDAYVGGDTEEIGAAGPSTSSTTASWRATSSGCPSRSPAPPTRCWPRRASPASSTPGHHLRGHRGAPRPGRDHHPHVDYLLANRDRIDAIIGLGDLVTGSIARVFDQVGVAPGEIPVVGWGNSADTTRRCSTAT